MNAAAIGEREPQAIARAVEADEFPVEMDDVGGIGPLTALKLQAFRPQSEFCPRLDPPAGLF
jgi:hypothetical protein